MSSITLLPAEKNVGIIFKRIDKNFTIGCLDGAIQILELKPEGKKNMSSLDFSFGHELIIGKIHQSSQLRIKIFGRDLMN